MPVSMPITSVSYQSGQRIERIDEPVAAPGIRVVVVNGPENPHGLSGQKGQRAARGARNDRAVDRPHRRRPAPDHVALRGIRRGNSPQRVAVVGELRVQFHAKSPMHVGGDHGVLEIVRISVALVAKIEPRLRILIDEQRRERADVAQPVVFEDGSLPGEPRVAVERMGRRSHAQQVHHHQLAVEVPPRRNESKFRRPSVRKQACIFRKPGPVHAIEDGMGQLVDVFVLKMLAAGQHAAEQNRGIDRRDLRIPHSLAGVDIREVIEESAMRGQLVPEKRQALDDAQPRVRVADKAALFGDANCRQAEAGGGDAGAEARVLGANIAAVLDQARLRIGLLPEEQEAGVLQVVQKLVVLRRERR